MKLDFYLIYFIKVFGYPINVIIHISKDTPVCENISHEQQLESRTFFALDFIYDNTFCCFC